jgi:hypothetical protein
MPVTQTFRCHAAGSAYRELQAAAALRFQAGLPTPLDLGMHIALRHGGLPACLLCLLCPPPEVY